MAKAYLSASAPEMLSRTWLDVFKEIESSYSGPSLSRWQKFMRSEPVRALVNVPLLETQNTQLLAAMRHPKAGVSVNKFLRMAHNRALDLGWLLSPVLARKLWPAFHYKEKRAITLKEHQRILEAENLEDYRLYYDMIWVTGGSQTDIANLHARNIDGHLLHFPRQKIRKRNLPDATLVIGPVLKGILDKLPKEGFFFPRLQPFGEAVRASHFRKVCERVGVEGVSLHSYRYSWGERAGKAGMPEREAMAHLSHNSAPVHRFYSRNAQTVTMPLEHYEEIRAKNIIQLEVSQKRDAQAIA